VRFFRTVGFQKLSNAENIAYATKMTCATYLASKNTMAHKVLIKDYLRGPYTLIDDRGTQTVVNTPVAPNKWLPGTTIDADCNVIAHEKHTAIVGIIDYVNHTGQGFNTRGVPLYLFHPLDRAYPPFIVASKERCASNMIVVVAFEHWNDRWARGGVVRRLGAVGDRNVERAALIMRAGFCAPTTYDAPTPPLHAAEPWDRCFNIDPAGCEDVDDVFAWRACGDGAHEFAIAIADVAAVVAEGTALDSMARARGTSVYEEGVAIIPMLPRAISERMASLRADSTPRPCLALSWIVDADGHASAPRWKQLTLTVERAYTYESFDDDHATAELLTKFLRAVGAGDTLTDSHAAVAAAMILYNKTAGELLVRNGRGLLRAHAGDVATPYAALADATGIQELRWLGAAAGRYVAATDTETRHAGLGLAAYAHASSPLRRYADLVNQRALKAILFETQAPHTDPELPTWLNARCGAAAALERDLWFAKHIQTHALSHAHGVVLRVRDCDIRTLLTVYVPEWRRKIRCVGTACVGDRVSVRIFCDLRAVRWDDRIVARSGHSPTTKTPP
jgi:exoribonuclease R